VSNLSREKNIKNIDQPSSQIYFSVLSFVKYKF